MHAVLWFWVEKGILKNRRIADTQAGGGPGGLSPLGTGRSSQSLLLPGLSNPSSLSLSSPERCSSPPSILVALLWTSDVR